MLGFKTVFHLMLFLFFAFAFACSPKCPEEGAFECLRDANGGVEHRVCIDGKWSKSKCASHEICTKEGCAALEVTAKDEDVDLEASAKAGDVALEASAKAEESVKNIGCLETGTHCLDDQTLQNCVKGELPRTQVCEQGKSCHGGVCAKTCSNRCLDEGEKAVDCGGTCAPCLECRLDTDCGKDGFCDSASGYVCSKRCRTDKDCSNSNLWNGEFCRDDGRCSPKVFETVWELTSSDLSVVLPFDPDYSDATCDFQILWGDESVGTDITMRPRVTDCTNIENRTHAYLGAGRYHVKIIGNYDGWGAFNKINLPSHDDLMQAAPKLRSVLSFGPVGLSQGAFYGASMLQEMPVVDIPDASKLRSLERAFSKASSFNAAIEHWDTSQVVNMSGMFSGALVFNQPLNLWNTSALKYMNAMFHSAAAFNQPLDAWDTSEVRNMYGLFHSANDFNQAIGAWNTSKVTNMSAMFHSATAFNQAIGHWDTSKVDNMTMMFNAAADFNQAIGAWNTSHVQNMTCMFSDALAFDQPIEDWDVSSVKEMSAMFYNAQAFNQPLDRWKTSKVFDISDMFSKTVVFNQVLGAWDTSHVQDFSRAFAHAQAFNQPLAAWDVSSARDMQKMFYEASKFNQNLSAWKLKRSVHLGDIFQSSGMRSKYLCALKAKGGAWLAQWSKLGKTVVCESY